MFKTHFYEKGDSPICMEGNQNSVGPTDIMSHNQN